jgi:pimeloyl-ACP methyl ester carboxylesterase
VKVLRTPPERFADLPDFGYPPRYADHSFARHVEWIRALAFDHLDKPFLVAFSDRDPITGSMAPMLKQAIPGAAGIEHPVITGAGHFLQEDAGMRLGTAIADFIRAHPAPREQEES